MEKILKLFIILLALTFIKFDVFAATTSTPTPANIQNQIDELKNKIASKVAELKLVEKRGIIGTVTDSSDTQITLSDSRGGARFVDVDELTKFYSSDKSFGISDIKNNMTIGILGLYNKQSRRILAREVNDITTPPKIIYGGIGSIDKQNFEITVVKENGAKVVIKIEDVTKTYSYSSDTLSKSGFSKIEETQTIMAIGFPDKLDPNKLIATRILIFPQIDIASRINLGSAINPTIPPSTGSGKKLYPLTK
ncbi:MAG: hypothetical protein AAB702_01395 [Patescibacteria group bacterium]